MWQLSAVFWRQWKASGLCLFFLAGSRSVCKNLTRFLHSNCRPCGMMAYGTLSLPLCSVGFHVSKHKYKYSRVNEDQLSLGASSANAGLLHCDTDTEPTLLWQHWGLCTAWAIALSPVLCNTRMRLTIDPPGWPRGVMGVALQPSTTAACDRC